MIAMERIWMLYISVSYTHLVLAYAKGKVDEIEFSGEDAARSDLDFACQVFGVAIAGGATIINVPDTVGYMNPNEFGDKIRYIKEHTPGIENAIISVHCHDDLGLANANTLAAIKAGARQVEGLSLIHIQMCIRDRSKTEQNYDDA